MTALMRLAACLVIIALLITPVATPASAQTPLPNAADVDAGVATTWFDLMLELIRQAPGYTPPVASRALGYAGVTLYESVAPGIPNARSLAGQLNGLQALPQPLKGAEYHWQLTANSAMAAFARRFFAGAGEPARTAIDGLETTLRKRYATGVSPATVRRSIEYGRQVAATIFAWSRTDGGHEGYMLNFPVDYTPPAGPGFWVSTPPAHLRALQPYWGDNRPFLLASNEECAPPPPPAYSTAPTSTLYIEAKEVYDTVRGLTPDQREIALYWSDDPSLTATPPGHSEAIATQILRTPGTSLARAAETYARLGIAVADSFVANWHIKFKYNQIRPITYIQRVLDPTWNWPRPTDPVITPPFPEYPSGHSTEAGSAAAVLTALFGDDYAFEDHSQERLGFAPRVYPSFHAAAEEAAISRLYGGIHFRSGNEGGLAQGRCIGERVMKLEMIGADQP